MALALVIGAILAAKAPGVNSPPAAPAPRATGRRARRAKSRDHAQVADASPERYRRDLRASHADRDRAVEFIREHAGEGRLTTEELEDRVGSALSAKTLGELDDLVADLPPQPFTFPTPPPPPPRSFLAGNAIRYAAAALFLLALSVPGGGHGVFLAFWFVAIMMLRVARRSDRRRRWEARPQAEARAGYPPASIAPTSWEPPRDGGWH